MKNFEFVVADNRAKAFKSFFLFLLFLHTAAAAILILSSSDKQVILGGYILGGSFLTTLILFRFINNKKLLLNACQLLFFIFWYVQSSITGMLICAVLLLLAKFIQSKKISIHFSDDAIVFKKIFFSKQYAWQQVDHVILKDGLLTIDFKSNKIIQLEIVHSFSFNEDAFNLFAKNELKN